MQKTGADSATLIVAAENGRLTQYIADVLRSTMSKEIIKNSRDQGSSSSHPPVSLGAGNRENPITTRSPHNTLNIINETGETLLGQAAQKGDIGSIKSLLERGADINIRDADGWTPLHYAVYNGKKDAVAFLLQHGADKHIENNDKKSALSLAESSNVYGQRPGQYYNISNSEKPYAMNIKEIHQMLENDKRQNVAPGKDEMSNMANSEVGKTAGLTMKETTFVNAILEGDLEAIKSQIKANPQIVNIPDTGGRTPLFYAITLQNKEVIQMLLASNANVNHTDEINRTPLYLAVEKGNVDIIKTLLAFGASLSIQKTIFVGARMSPLELAIRRNRSDILEVFQPFFS